MKKWPEKPKCVRIRESLIGYIDLKLLGMLVVLKRIWRKRMTLAEIGREAQCNPKTASFLIHELESAGIITVKSGRTHDGYQGALIIKFNDKTMADSIEKDRNPDRKIYVTAKHPSRLRKSPHPNQSTVPSSAPVPESSIIREDEPKLVQFPVRKRRKMEINSSAVQSA